MSCFIIKSLLSSSISPKDVQTFPLSFGFGESVATVENTLKKQCHFLVLPGETIINQQAKQNHEQVWKHGSWIHQL